MEVQAEEEQAFLARQQAALSGLKDPTRSPTTRNQASPGPVIQVIPLINGACSSCCVPIKSNNYSIATHFFIATINRASDPLISYITSNTELLRL